MKANDKETEETEVNEEDEEDEENKNETELEKSEENLLLRQGINY